MNFENLDSKPFLFNYIRFKHITYNHVRQPVFYLHSRMVVLGHAGSPCQSEQSQFYFFLIPPSEVICKRPPELQLGLIPPKVILILSAHWITAAGRAGIMNNSPSQVIVSLSDHMVFSMIALYRVFA